MLSELFIENVAIIEKAKIEFDMGLSVFTGETGAGKSIIIDSINAVLGYRTSKDIVRYNKNKAVVTATFVAINKNAQTKLKKYGYELEDDSVIITREIFSDSKSVARIMGRPVNLNILKEVTAELLTIHGQNDNQILLSQEKHLEIIDAYGDFEYLKKEYLDCYKLVVNLKRELNKLVLNQDDKEKKIELLKYQMDEIESANIQINEDTNIENQLSKIKNSSKILQNLNNAYISLFGSDDIIGGIDLVKTAGTYIEKSSDYYEDTKEISVKMIDICAELDDISYKISSLIDDIDFDENMLDELQERINLINRLKSKYGDSIDDIFNNFSSMQEELSNISTADERIKELYDLGKKEFERLIKMAGNISDKRKQTSKQFIKQVTDELVFLDMPDISLDVDFQNIKPNITGIDTVEFLISTNKGEPKKPISKVASGGELSRIMLAIKNTIADKDEIDTLIFDEVDTGVSGRAAQKIGLKLVQASKNKQIISVTHLAQIAALADNHYLIKKESDKNSTHTNIDKLNYDGRVKEVARIMSTDKITDLMIENAKEMIEFRGNK